MSLPIYQSKLPELSLLQTQWASQLNPVIQNQLNNSLILENVNLVNGVNVINHLLGRNLQGWFIVRQRAAASIYDNQASNPSPQLTLVLVSNAAVTVNIVVF